MKNFKTMDLKINKQIMKENIVSVCSVVRSEANQGDTNFKIALKFVDIDVNHQNIINEYVNKKRNLIGNGGIYI